VHNTNNIERLIAEAEKEFAHLNPETLKATLVRRLIAELRTDDSKSDGNALARKRPYAPRSISKRFIRCFRSNGGGKQEMTRTTIVFVASNLALWAAIAAMVAVIVLWDNPIPSKWNGATVLRICRDGTPIVQLADGSVWARRSGVLAYRVDRKPEEVCE
jgi:hypothetical protein